MLKTFFLIVVLTHGLIHLIGFFRAFIQSETTLQLQPISKLSGVFWLLLGLLFFLFSFSYLIDSRYWILIGFISIVLSQTLIITEWHEAKFGTIANVIILVALFVGLEQRHFKQAAQDLLTSSLIEASMPIAMEDISKLPEPVQRYYNYAIKDSTLSIQNVRLKHKGQFRTDPNNDWMFIKGEQYFSVSRAGFLWRGKTILFTAFDRYVDGKGGLTVKLLSLFNIVQATGEEAEEAELQRWIAENFWFPINLFKNKSFRWKSINNNQAELIFNDPLHHDLSMTATFNDTGQLTLVECSRYMAEGRFELWRGYPSEYIEYQGMMIPSRIEAAWVVDGRDYSYAKFFLDTINYNVLKVY